jgi:hypothetical protein
MSPNKAFVRKSLRPLASGSTGVVKHREITLRGTRFVTAYVSYKVIDDTTLAETVYEIQIDIDPANTDLDKPHGDFTLSYLVQKWLSSMTFFVRNTSLTQKMQFNFTGTVLNSSDPRITKTNFGDLSLMDIGAVLGEISFQDNSSTKIYTVSAAPPKNGPIQPTPPFPRLNGKSVDLNYTPHGDLEPAVVAKLVELMQFTVTVSMPGPSRSGRRRKKVATGKLGPQNPCTIRHKIHCE